MNKEVFSTFKLNYLHKLHPKPNNEMMSFSTS